jgi:hypothetical protein
VTDGVATRSLHEEDTMTTMRRWRATVLALGLSAGLSVGLVVSGSLTGASAARGTAAGEAAHAGSVPACTVSALNVRKGRLEGAAGSRYQTVRVTNEGDSKCSVPGYPRYRFRDGQGPIGFHSVRGNVTGRVVIRAGETARSQLSWTDPGPVPRARCHPHRATGFTVKIKQLPGHYVLPLHAQVCTTRKYRPHASILTT